MGRTLSLKSPYQTIIAVTVTFILLNAFFPLPFQAESTQYPFKLTITLEKTTYKLREHVYIKFYLKNIANENLTIQFPWQEIDDFIVYDENFVKVYRLNEERVFADVLNPPRTMKPGETLNWTLTWYQSTGWEVLGTVGNPDFEIRYYWAEPGVYYIVGIFESETYTVTVRTPPLMITIA
jgi:hypothetical protein